MRKRFAVLAVLSFVLVLAGSAPRAYAQRAIVIKIGTVAPSGTLWHQILQQMGQDWTRISDGRVKVTIYEGGRLGDEGEMLLKVRRRTLHAVALSGAGLSKADTGVSSLQIPMMISSYAELDYVMERVTPTLEKRLEEKNLIVLNWSDVGWVHFFTKEPARTLDDIREMKLFTSSGDFDTESLYRELGFNPVPMPVTEMLTNLTTGLIDAMDVPPLFALADQSFGVANNMIDLRWAPLVGATVIDKDAWETIPADLRPAFLEAARGAVDEYREKIRQMGEESIATMRTYNLNVIELDEATRADWQAEAEAAYPKIRGRLVPEELFDKVEELRDQYRRTRTAPEGGP